MKGEKIIIVGAGLCGTLLAIRMAEKGFQVRLYERRSDMRLGTKDAGRSINLALSTRGLLSLEKAGLKDKILNLCIPMRGRMIHPAEGASFLSNYSGRQEDYINSVSRPGLNLELIEQADAYPNVDIVFNAKVVEVDLKEARISYVQDGVKKEDQASIVIGTDGAGSVIRRSMLGRTTDLLFNYSQDFLRYGYKELTIHADEIGGWKIEKEALHIWPNGSYMVIALPNLDGSFTLTMFHPFDGDAGFNTLNSEDKLLTFFEQHYPTLLPYIPHLRYEYFENPMGTLGTIKCYPWQAYGKSLIMGDACHAIVPFYGQGMNASLEDVRIFMELLEEHGPQWEQLFSAFQEHRKKDTDAIADLAIDNFVEMRDQVDDEAFMRKRKIEMKLEETFPDYYSKYSLVTFRPLIGYDEAMTLGRKQDKLLLKMCSDPTYDTIAIEEFHRQLIQVRS